MHVCMYVAPHVCRPRWQNKQTVRHFRTKRMDKLGWVVFIRSSVQRGRHLKQTIRHFRTQRMDKLGWVVSFTAVWRQTGTNPSGTTLHACRLSELRMTTPNRPATDGREKSKRLAISLSQTSWRARLDKRVSPYNSTNTPWKYFYNTCTSPSDPRGFASQRRRRGLNTTKYMFISMNFKAHNNHNQERDRVSPDLRYLSSPFPSTIKSPPSPHLGVEGGAHDVVVVPGQDRDTRAALPVPDANRLRGEKTATTTRRKTRPGRRRGPAGGGGVKTRIADR